jgi:hypothetical protein
MHLCDKFGRDNVYVVTSNDTELESNVLDFEEKRQILGKYGIENVFQCDQPYRPIEVLQTVEDDCILVVAVGEKDKLRLNQLIRTKRDGSIGYYELYDELMSDLPYRKKGYVYVIPNINVRWNDTSISGTFLRNTLPTMTSDEFKAIMGWYDSDIHELFKMKFDIIRPKVSPGKHLNHPWEYLQFTYNDILELIDAGLNGKLANVTEKIDAQNILVTITPDGVRFARNKSEIVTPLDKISFLQKFIEKPKNVQLAFRFGVDLLCKLLDPSKSNKITELFANKSYLNLEIVTHFNPNVIEYGIGDVLVFHNLIQYDSNGNEITRNVETAKLLYELLNRPRTVYPPKELKLLEVYGAKSHYRNFKDQLDLIWRKHGLSELNTIQDYLDACAKFDTKKLNKSDLFREYIYPIEILLNKLAVIVLSEIDYGICKNPNAVSAIRKNIAEVSTRILHDGNPLLVHKLQTEMGKLSAIGGYDAILPIEGIVFSFKNNWMKFTGAFKYTNQILGIYRYSR